MSYDLKARFPDMQPDRRPGPLSTTNGFGTALMGRRDFDPETGNYVATHVFRALFVPIWALGAYRVADAPSGGWYCLGKVPLSTLARAWNVAIILILVGGITGIWWNSHSKSPNYIAGRKLKQADEAAAAGKGGEAARLCREVMDSQSTKTEDGRTKLAGFIENPPGAPSEAAAVYQVAVDLHRENRCPVPDMFDKGKAIAERHATDDPAAALALLEVIAPFAPDAAAELTLRRDVLEKLFARSPDDPAVASRLAAVYEQKGEREKIEKLLTPFENRLGTLDGAAILGRIHASAGRYDKAHALLAPFVAARLPALRDADAAFTATITTAQERVITQLKGGKAPGFDYAKYDKSQKGQQQTMVSDYINDQLKNDPAIRTVLQKRAGERVVVGTVIDLGLVQLQRAQAKTDPAARKAELEAAEKTFLSIRSIAGEDKEYRLSLGRVYYWLGRPTEGKKLFDAILAEGRTTPMQLAIANVFREIGENTEARKMTEEAFKTEKDATMKYRAAQYRALLYTDLEDEILWLSRCDPNDRDVQASLATTRGRKAERDGNDTAAAEAYRQAIAIYIQFPENAATLNNTALAHLALFKVTLDRDEFTRGMDKLDRAVALDPTSTITLHNASGLLAEGAARDTVGKEVNFLALKSPPAWDAVPYLYRTPAERAAVAEKLAKHPGVVKSRGYAEKLMVLAPKRDDSYQLLSSLHEHTNDLEGMKAVAARAAKADFDLGNEKQTYMDFLTGKDDAKKLEDARAFVTRTTEALAASRSIGGRTFAVAAGRYIRAKTAAAIYNQPVDADELVKLADEAHVAAPSAGTESALHVALTFRADLALIRDDAGYAAMAKRTQRSFSTTLLYYVLTVDSPLRAKAVTNADVKRLAVLAEEEYRRDPDRVSTGNWIPLRAVGSALTKEVAEKAQANERSRARRELARATAPYSAATALDEYWSLLLAGKDAEAKKVITDLGAKGVPIP